MDKKFRLLPASVERAAVQILIALMGVLLILLIAKAHVDVRSSILGMV